MTRPILHRQAGSWAIPTGRATRPSDGAEFHRLHHPAGIAIAALDLDALVSLLREPIEPTDDAIDVVLQQTTKNHMAADAITALRERPDLYASLAAVTLPPKGGAMPSARSAALTGRACYTSRAKPAVAIAIDALMWAVFAGCFALIASGRL